MENRLNYMTKPLKAKQLVEKYKHVVSEKEVSVIYPEAVFLESISVSYDYQQPPQEVGQIVAFLDGGKPVFDLDKAELIKTIKGMRERDKSSGIVWKGEFQKHAVPINHQFRISLRLKGNSDGLVFYLPQTPGGSEAIPR